MYYRYKAVIYLAIVYSIFMIFSKNAQIAHWAPLVLPNAAQTTILSSRARLSPIFEAARVLRRRSSGLVVRSTPNLDDLLGDLDMPEIDEDVR